MLVIAPLFAVHIPEMVSAFEAIGWNKPPSQFERYLEQQENGQRRSLVARRDRTFVGYVTVLWQSTYAPFATGGIPEISDLNVLPDFRKSGVATVLMEEAEAAILPRSATAGVAVGLAADYGPAQRLYARRGYVPDGNGATSHGKQIRYGSSVAVDDDLVLHLMKHLVGN